MREVDEFHRAVAEQVSAPLDKKVTVIVDIDAEIPPGPRTMPYYPTSGTGYKLNRLLIGEGGPAC
jgi:hypothetical protein